MTIGKNYDAHKVKWPSAGGLKNCPNCGPSKEVVWVQQQKATLECGCVILLKSPNTKGDCHV